jgi:hypothetical protein
VEVEEAESSVEPKAATTGWSSDVHPHPEKVRELKRLKGLKGLKGLTLFLKTM